MSETIEELQSLEQELDTFDLAISKYIEEHKNRLKDSEKEILRELVVESKRFLTMLNWRVRFLRERLYPTF